MAAPTPHHGGPLQRQQADEAGRLPGAFQNTARPQDTHVGAHGPVHTIFVLRDSTQDKWGGGERDAAEPHTWGFVGGWGSPNLGKDLNQLGLV